MEQEQNESPRRIAFDPSKADNVSLVGCPFLGLADDPHTTLAFPHKANYCHRLQTPVGVDLAHQGSYCLSKQYPDCYVYGDADEAQGLLEEESIFGMGISLAMLKAKMPAFKREDLPSPAVYLSALGWKRPSFETIDWQSWKDRLPAITVALAAFKQRIADSNLELGEFAVAEKLKAINFDRDLLRSRLSAVDLDGAKARITAVDLAKFDPRRLPVDKAVFAGLIARLRPITSTLEDARLRLPEIERRRAGLIALPLMLLLIVLAAVIWWPPPGEADPAALALNPTTLVAPLEQPSRDTSLAPGAASVAEANADSAVAAEGEAGQPSGSSDSQAEVSPALELPGETAAISLEPADMASDEAALPAEEPAAVSEPEALSASRALDAEVVLDNGEAAAEQAPPDEPAAVETASEEAASSDTPAAPQAEAGPLPAATVANIGPDESAAGLSESTDPAPPLSLHRLPNNGAEVLTQLTERIPASILGRSENGEWLLVRLGTGNEGWIHALESGAAVVVSSLPVVEDVLPAAASADTAQEAVATGDVIVQGIGVVNTGALNLRAGPGLEYDPVGMVFNGQPVSLLELPGDGRVWVQVLTADGLFGWMNSNYMLLNN